MRRLLYYRLLKNLTQKDLEEDLSIRHTEYSRIENGKILNPRYETMTKISAALQIDIVELLSEATLEQEEFVKKTRKEAYSRSGKQGGATTALIYGRKYMREMGKRGSDLASAKRTARAESKKGA